MADFKISGRMTVENIQEQFKNEFKGSLRLYDGNTFADPKATLASIRKGDAKGNEFSISPLMFVGTFEDLMMENYGIKVQVASLDNTQLIHNQTELKLVKNSKGNII